MNGPTSEFPRLSAAGLRSARQLLQRKQRLEQGLFLVDGRQCVREALQAGFVQKLIVSLHDVASHQDLVTLATTQGVHTVVAPKAEVEQLSKAVTPQGIVAICESVAVDVATALPRSPSLVVVCAQARDPGNCGTVIRCADAFGADAVIMTAGSVELGNAKTVRASVGSIFHVPIVVGANLGQTLAELRRRGLQILAADGGGETLPEVDLGRPTCWVMGNEAWGLPEEVLALCDRRVGIPMWGQAESLNLSTAAAVCLYTTASAQRSRETRC